MAPGVLKLFATLQGQVPNMMMSSMIYINFDFCKIFLNVIKNLNSVKCYLDLNFTISL